jgi:hypothetical protein
MGFGWLRTEAPPAEAHVEVTPQTGPTVVRELRALSRLETASLHVEKVIEVKDHQKRLHGLIDADDSLLFVAVGEVVLGVDLSKSTPTFDEATKTAHIELPDPEVFSTRFDEQHSHVAARKTDWAADRNEQLEAEARREGAKAFTAAGRETNAQDLARLNAEKQLTTLARAWGAQSVEITWKSPPSEVDLAAK